MAATAPARFTLEPPPPVADVRRTLRRAVVVVFALWLPVVLFWERAPFAVTFDDAYYYFGVARNIAHGHGSTFDLVDKTNGYHPLWMAICVFPYLLGVGGSAAVRVLLTVQLALWAVALWVVAGMVADAIDRWPRLFELDRSDEERAAAVRRATRTVAALLVVAGGNPFVVKLFVNGLESGVVAVIGALLLADAVRAGTAGWLADADDPAAGRTRRVTTGAILSLAFLARTDAVVMAAALGLWCLPEAVLLGRAGVRRMVELFFMPVATFVLYSALNILAFDHPLQISGVVKRLPVTATRALTLAAVAGVAGLGAAAARRLGRGDDTRFPRTATFTARTAWYAAACLVLAAYYHVLSVESYLWYYAPAGLYVLALLVHVAADLCEGAVVEAPASKSERRAMVPIQVILLVPLVAAAVFTGRLLAAPKLSSLARGDHTAAEWVRGHVADDAVLASWDAGIIGYASGRPVVNLDGVVNSYEWRDAAHAGTPATGAFLRARHVTYIVNHGVATNGEDLDLRRRVDALFGDGVGQRLQLVYRVDYEYDGNLGGVDATGKPVATFVYELAPQDR